MGVSGSAHSARTAIRACRLGYWSGSSDANLVINGGVGDEDDGEDDGDDEEEDCAGMRSTCGGVSNATAGVVRR